MRQSMFWLRIVTLAVISLLCYSQGYAAEPSGEYLAYQEPKPAGASSWLSTIAYIISLLVTFAVVLGLAYVASRFLGNKMGTKMGSEGSQILATLPLGQTRAIYVVEIAGKCLVVGVTEHSIQLLQQIEDEEEIAKLKNGRHLQPAPVGFESILERQLASLQDFSNRFPTLFDVQHRRDTKEQQEKR